MADLLDMDYINGLPQPFLGRTAVHREWWPIYDFEVQTGLVRIDVCGKLEVKSIADFTAFRDGAGVERSSEAFYADANEDERAPISGVRVVEAPSKLLTPRAWQMEAMTRAAKFTGSPEGALALVEAKRYGLMADELERIAAGVRASDGGQQG